MACSENEHYIIRCPSDNSESPEVSRRGHLFRLGAADEAFESSFGADDVNCWIGKDDLALL